MSNPPRKKGTAAETAAVRWFRGNGFGHADRQPLRGGRDQGDLTLCPGVIAEIKSYRLPTGVPTRGQLDEWMRQTEAERVNAGASDAVLIVKRPGTTDVGRWFAYVTAHALAELLNTPTYRVQSPARTAPVCMTVADLAVILRAAGWGDRLEEEVA